MQVIEPGKIQLMTTVTRSPVEPFTSVKDDAVTALLSLWLMAGLMIDGWAHTTRGGVESFFTPWHAAFYSGFLATAAWIVYLVWRPRRGFVQAGIPTGYRLALTGLAIFGAGGVLDLVWHETLGIEVDIDALLSPTHMVLLVGAMLVVTTPLRSGWHRPTPRKSKWGWIAPPVISVGQGALLAQFFVFYASGWQGPAFREPWDPGESDFLVAFSVLSLTVSTLIFMVAFLLVLLRWSPPPGAFALILGIVGLGLQGVHGFEKPGELIAAVVAGFVLDGLALRLQPAPQAPSRLQAWAFLAPIAVWGVHSLYLAIAGEFNWPPVLWGVLVLQGLVGLTLATLAAPPTVPPQALPSQVDWP